MINYIARRGVQLVPVLLGLTFITFLLTYVVPGDPIDLIAKQERLSPDARETLRRQLGLDESLPVQYVRYLWRLLQGDLGRSYVTNQRVAEAIAGAFPITLRLGIAAFLLSAVLGVGAGVAAASRPHSWIDRTLTVLTLTGISLPVIWVAPVAILLFAVGWRVFPPSGYDGWFSLVLPALVLGVRAAFNARIARTSMLEVIGHDPGDGSRRRGDLCPRQSGGRRLLCVPRSAHSIRLRPRHRGCGLPRSGWRARGRWHGVDSDETAWGWPARLWSACST